MQPLQPIGRGMHPAAEETLALSNVQRGMPGMSRTSAPVGPERILSEGMADKVEMNTQPYNNARLSTQNQKQNIITAVPQAQANAIRGVRNPGPDEQAKHMAQEKLNRTVSEVLYANDGGAALMKMNALNADPPAMRNFIQRIAEAKTQSAGNNPHTQFESTNFYG